MNETTRLLRRSATDPRAREEFYRRVYAELEDLARKHLRNESEGLSLSVGDLVHHACVRLLNYGGAQANDRHHFLNRASRIMRNVLVDHARTRGSLRRGGDRARFSVRDDDHVTEDQAAEWLHIDEILNRLVADRPVEVKMFELSYFSGLDDAAIREVIRDSMGEERSVEQIAHALKFIRALVIKRVKDDDGEAAP